MKIFAAALLLARAAMSYTEVQLSNHNKKNHPLIWHRFDGTSCLARRGANRELGTFTVLEQFRRTECGYKEFCEERCMASHACTGFVHNATQNTCTLVSGIDTARCDAHAGAYTTYRLRVKPGVERHQHANIWRRSRGGDCQRKLGYSAEQEMNHLRYDGLRTLDDALVVCAKDDQCNTVVWGENKWFFRQVRWNHVHGGGQTTRQKMQDRKQRRAENRGYTLYILPA